MLLIFYHFHYFSANGACISKEFQCDGLMDCQDESDENYLLCGKNRTLSEVSDYILAPGICGTSSTPFIAHARPSKHFEYPWIALILHTYGN